MALNYRILPQAVEDLEEAILWLGENAGSHIREKFILDYIRTRRKVCEFPLLFAPFYQVGNDEFRKFRFAEFPFNLVYSYQNETIIIVAVAHDMRRPFYWR